MRCWLRHKHTNTSGYVTDCDRENMNCGKSRVYQQHQIEKSLVFLQTCLLVKVFSSRMQDLCLHANTAFNDFRGLYVVMV